VSLNHRAVVTPELLAIVRDSYGLPDISDPVDLGGSMNLNVRFGRWVIRVYCPWVSPERVAAIQRVRGALVDAGFPFARTLQTRAGEDYLMWDRRVVEVEGYIPGQKMRADDQLVRGMAVLGRIHTTLQSLTVSPAGRTAPTANNIEPWRLLAATRLTTDLLRADPETVGLADRADELAGRLVDAERAVTPVLPRQIVHGDFWDNNVLFRDDDIVVILDLDFMGERARIDDVALTLYYTNSTFGGDYTSRERLAFLRRIVDAYDSGLASPLSTVERSALPLAIARTALGLLCHLPDIDEPTALQRFVEEMRDDIGWAADVVDNRHRWHRAFA